jgi:hypothetical protein
MGWCSRRPPSAVDDLAAGAWRELDAAPRA